MAMDLYMHDFVHVSLANIINSLPLYIDLKVFDFQEWTLSTYDKAVQRYEQENVKSPHLPYLVCDQTLSLEVDETSQMHWKFPGVFGAGNVSSLYQPIIKTEDIVITPLFLTINLNIDLIAWFESVYQKLDYEMAMLLRFGGFNRWTIPYAITYDVPYPNALQDDTYIDLSQYGISKAMYKTLGKEMYVLPIYTKPLFRLNTISDNSEKYGSDNVAQWRSIINLTMKVQVFTGLHIISDWQLRDLNIKLSVDNPNVVVSDLIGHGDPVENNDEVFSNILIPYVYKIKPNEQHVIFETDRAYGEDEEFAIDLSGYEYTTIKLLFLEGHDAREDGSMLYIKGPFYKGQHVHLILAK
jgi:hypothetical protein